MACIMDTGRPGGARCGALEPYRQAGRLRLRCRSEAPYAFSVLGDAQPATGGATDHAPGRCSPQASDLGTSYVIIDRPWTLQQV
jgi:hypothetical protein